jgi:hypothetical protein
MRNARIRDEKGNAMTDRERLIEICDTNCGYVDEVPAEIFADHLIAHGVIVMPCKVGDTVWAIRSYQGHKHAQQGFVSEMYFLPDMTLHIVVKHIARGEFGKAVFLTREEADAAIAKKGGNQ